MHRKSIKHMDSDHQHKNEECADGCNGEWMRCATEVLRNNFVELPVFAVSMRELLTKGRRKICNMMIVALLYCAKTYLLSFP